MSALWNVNFWTVLVKKILLVILPVKTILFHNACAWRTLHSYVYTRCSLPRLPLHSWPRPQWPGKSEHSNRGSRRPPRGCWHVLYSHWQRLRNVLSKLTTKTHQRVALLALCEGNPMINWGLSLQRLSNTESVTLSWRHHYWCCFGVDGVFLVAFWVVDGPFASCVMFRCSIFRFVHLNYSWCVSLI